MRTIAAVAKVRFNIADVNAANRRSRRGNMGQLNLVGGRSSKLSASSEHAALNQLIIREVNYATSHAVSLITAFG